jgi:dihydroxy-acid dehydratase
VGGPLAIVQTGDRIALDVDGRRLDLLVDGAEITRRMALWRSKGDRYEHAPAATLRAPSGPL